MAGKNRVDDLDSSAEDMLSRLNGQMSGAADNAKTAAENDSASVEELKESLGGKLPDEKYDELRKSLIESDGGQQTGEAGDLRALVDEITAKSSEGNRGDDEELFKMMKEGAKGKMSSAENNGNHLQQDILEAESFMAENPGKDDEEPQQMNVDAYSTDPSIKKDKKTLREARLREKKKAKKKSGASGNENLFAKSGEHSEDVGEYEPDTGSHKFSDTKERPAVGEKQKKDHSETEMMMVAFGYEPNKDEVRHESKDGYDEYSFNMDDDSFSTLNTTDESYMMTTDNIPIEEPIEEMIDRPVYEYTDPDKSRDIFNAFKNRIKSNKLKMFGCAVAAIFLFVWEFILKLPSVNAGIDPVVFFAVDWLVTFVVALLVIDRMIYAVNCLIHKKIDVDLITLLAFLFALAASIVDMTVYSTTFVEIYTYNFTFAVFAFFNLLSSNMLLKRDVYAFKVISSQKPKRLIARASASEKAREEVAFGEYLGHESEIYKIKNADFVSDFFANRDRLPKNRKPLMFFIPAVFAVSLAAFFVSFFALDGGTYESVTSAYIAFMMCAPMTAFASYSYPAYLGAVKSYARGAAILSEGTPEKMENAAVITFSDDDAFPADKVKMKSIRCFQNVGFENVIYYASSVFSVIGGPLATVFKNATLNSVISENVEIKELSDTGIDAYVDGKHVFVGQAEYMENQCFETVREDMDESYGQKSNVRILYLACDEVIIGKFTIQYNVSPEFIYIVRRLYDDGICVAISTIDPCIDSNLLYKNRLSPEQYPIKVLKGVPPLDVQGSVSACDCGVASIGSLKGQIKTLLICDKLVSVSKTNLVMKIVASVLGALAFGFLLFSGLATGSSVGSLIFYPAVYQLFWMIPMYLISNIYIK